MKVLVAKIYLSSILLSLFGGVIYAVIQEPEFGKFMLFCLGIISFVLGLFWSASVIAEDYEERKHK